MNWGFYRLLSLLLIFSGTVSSQPATQQSSEIRHFDSLLAKGRSIYGRDPDSSMLYTNEALNYALKYKLEIQKALALYSRARIETLQGDVEQALKDLKEAVVIYEKNKEMSKVAGCYDLMATAFGKIDKSEAQCIELLQKACEIYRKEGNTDGLQNSLVNLANNYAYINAYDKGIAALTEVKNYILPGSEEWFYYYINVGLIQMRQKKFAQARLNFDSCVAISRRHKMLDAEITAITEVGTTLHGMKKTGEAISYFTKAIEMSRTHNLPIEESDALKGLLGCYVAMNNYKGAFICQSRLKAISDSLFDIKKVKNVKLIETKLKVSEKEKTIALQKLSMEENARIQKEDKERILLLIGGALLLAAALSVTVFIYMRTKKQKREVELQKARVERLNSLNQKIFSVIAHDFKSPLITLQMLIDLLDKTEISREDLTSYTADVRHQITQSNQILENLLNWARTELNVAHNRNLTADPRIIAGEIEKELSFMASKKGIRFINALPEKKLFRIPPDILKIITRNLVSNAIKYSYENNEITIGLNERDAIYIKDNGVGMKEQKINELFTGTVKSSMGTFNETGFGLGLYITYELINKFSGKIWVEKNNPSGTVFIFAIPPYEQN